MVPQRTRLSLLLAIPLLALLATVAFESTRRVTVAAAVQESIEAAADAALAELDDVDTAIEAAQQTARRAARTGMVVELRVTDIEIGSVQDGVFQPAHDHVVGATAVRITTTQPYPTVMAPLWGVRQWSVTQSIVRQSDARQANRS